MNAAILVLGPLRRPRHIGVRHCLVRKRECRPDDCYFKRRRRRHACALRHGRAHQHFSGPDRNAGFLQFPNRTGNIIRPVTTRRAIRIKRQGFAIRQACRPPRGRSGHCHFSDMRQRHRQTKSTCIIRVITDEIDTPGSLTHRFTITPVNVAEWIVHGRTARSFAAASSGSTSTRKTPAPCSTPARYLSFPTSRRNGRISMVM